MSATLPLSQGIFTDATLGGTNLTDVDFELADLTDVMFKQTILTGAKNMENAIGLTRDQMKEACGRGIVTVSVDGEVVQWPLPPCHNSCPQEGGGSAARLQGKKQ